MKKPLLMILIILLILLTACADASVSYTLDESNSINSSYTVTIHSTQVDARSYAGSIEDYWKGLGFNAVTKTEDGNVVVEGVKTGAYEDRQSAADAFAQILVSEDSLFYDAEFEYTPSFEQDIYTLSAYITLEDIIRQNEMQNIPDSEINSLIESAEEGEYLLSLKLPGEITQTNADTVNDGVCTWNLEFGEETHLILSTVLMNTQSVESYNELKEKVYTSGMLMRLSIAAAGLLLVVIITLLVYRAVKKSRS